MNMYFSISIEWHFLYEKKNLYSIKFIIVS